MEADRERLRRVGQLLQDRQFDAILCNRPDNVLMLSGYWPVTGKSLAIAIPDTADARVALLVPEDERELAEQGWASDVRTFKPGSLHEVRSTADAMRQPLQAMLGDLGLAAGGSATRVGIEGQPASLPAPYVAVFQYNAALPAMLEDFGLKLSAADEVLGDLRSVKTPGELARIRLTCDVAAKAFETGARQLQPGLTEAQAAVGFRAELSCPPSVGLDRHRADGFVYCMSGPNAYHALAAYQRSRSRPLSRGELALIHCNSYVDGFWSDITRTFVIGQPDEQQRRMYDAIFAARQAALETIRPGVAAADVDRAVRQVMSDRGFGDAFKTPSGHGIGFAAIDHNAAPQIHPESRDVLKTGMVFNIEPGIYVKNVCGMRHCDVVAVSERGAEVLTPFLCGAEALAIPGE